jgi:hypothetical protein
MMGKKRDNTGQSYEILVQAIFQAIHDQEEVATLIVERNKRLQSKTVPHQTYQVDVYWKFEKGGIPYEAIVQAKDWQSRVKLGQLVEFKGVLDDLPGQPRGIFVTRSGYQRGAKAFAAAHGIILYELDEPRRANTTITTLGWVKYEAEVRSFKLPPKEPGHEPVQELAMGLKPTIYQPRCSNIQFDIDSAWFAQNPATRQLDTSRIKLHRLPIVEVILYGQNEAPATNLEAVVREEIGILKDEKSDRKRVVHVFTGDTFIGPPCTDGPFFKINKVSFDLEIEVTKKTPHFNLSKFVRLVLREIGSGKTQTFLALKA